MALTAFCAASFANASEDFRRPNIEAVQRAIQERYLTWAATVRANGVEPEGFPAKITWPALSNGKQPGDSPKDCFYSEELIDGETGEINYNLLCFLIADLVNKTVAFLPDSEYADPDLADRINGRSQITLPPAIWPGSQVNPDNYNAFFETVCAHVQRHSHPIIEIRSTDDSGDLDLGGAGRGVEDDAATCAAAKASALSDLASASEETEQDLLLGRVDRVYFSGVTHTASIAAWRGRYGFAHSAFGPLGGAAKLYFFARDYFKVVDGTPATVPLSAGGAPVPEYEKHYLIDTFSLSSGGKHFSTEIGTLPTSFISPCPALEGEANAQRSGYFIHPIVIAAPNFAEQIGEIYTDCKECKACMSGACPPGGTSTAKAGSITYSIPLGSSLDGSAGSMTIYSETADFLMATPFGLKITAGKDSTILRDLAYDGIPRQIMVPQGLVDIKVDTPAKAYSVRFYDMANRGAKVGGFYQPEPSTAYKTISVTNPGLNSPVIAGKFNLALNNYQISAPAHGLTPGSYYVMRVDADSGSLPAGFAIGRMSRQHLYYIYALNSSTLAFLYFNAAGSAFLDGMTDAIPGQVLKFSSPFPFTNLTISEVTEGQSRVLDYSYQTPSSTKGIATLSDVTSTRSRVHIVETNYVDATHRTEDQTEADGAGNVILKTQHKYEVLPWNRASAVSRSERQTLVAETLDPDGRALTTTYSYYTNSTTDGVNYARLKEVQRPQGAWERYEYDWDGRAIRTYSSYLDVAPTSSGSGARLTEQSPTGGASIPDADGDGVNENLESTIDYIAGAEVSRSYQLMWSAVDALGRQRSTTIRCLEPGASWDAPANVRSDTWSHTTGRFAGQLAKRVDESGLLTVYSYGLDPASGVQTSVELSGVAGSDGESVVAGTKIVTLVNAAGNVTDVTTSDIVSGIVLQHEYTPAAYFDQFGRATRVYGLDGRYSQSIRQDCCGTATTVSNDGVISSRETDATGQLLKTVRAGIAERYSDGFTAAAPGALTGYTRSTYRKGRGDAAEVLVKLDTFDKSGALIASLDPRDGVNRVTRFSEGLNATDRWVQKVISPDGGETSHALFRDGSASEELRDGVRFRKYVYGVENAAHDGRTFNARTTTEIKLGDDDSETEWEKTYTDPLGRQFRTEWPDADGNAADISALMYYDTKGRLVRKVDADGVPTLFDQDAIGNVQVEALDVNRNGMIDFGGLDRVQRTTRSVVTDPDRGDVVRTTTDVWESDDDPVVTTLSISDVSTNGLQSWSTAYGQTVHSTKTYPGGGSSVLVVERPDHTVETTTTQRGVVIAQKVEHPGAGTLQSVVNAVDDLDRTQSTANQLTGRATSFEYFENDSVHKVTDLESAGSSPQTTQFQYDLAGRLNTTVLADGSRSEKRYFTSGELRAQFGGKDFPTEYTYDRQGRAKTLTTWQRFDDALASGVSGAAVTTWSYDARGRLKAKRDSGGKGSGFTYTSGGRINTRASARLGVDGTNPILTTYRYGTQEADDLSVESGDVTAVFYSNDPAGTHVVGTTYDRRGRPRTILDGSGARELAYDGEQLDRESYVDHAGTPSLFAGYVIERDFDEMKRFAGLNLAIAGVPAYNVAFGYDAASRLQAVTFGAQKVTYAYNPAASKRITMDYQRGGQSVLSVEQSFDGLNRLTGRTSVAGLQTKSVAYVYDALNRRSRVTEETGKYRSLGYDAHSQLALDTQRTSDGTPVPFHAFGYTYDDIGNRRTATLNGRLQFYEPNLLNQYGSVVVPRIVEFRGTAHPTATITVDGATVTERSDRSFSKDLDLTGPPELAAAHFRSIQVRATLAGGGVNASDRTATENRDVFLAKSPVMFSYDPDGNLLDDDQWIYGWDAENRLISMSTKPGFATATDPGAERRTRLEFSYDSGGRRITKKSFSWQPLTMTWVPVLARSFVYDGWNLLAEFDLSSGARVASYAWGTDLGGDFQSSGGIGGLLFCSTATRTTAPIYDGSGNIVAQVDTASGAVLAEREYDAWGRVLNTTEPSDDGCAFGFSTKYRDQETDFSYYGLRYLEHGNGRWLSRDPFGEDGGANLMAFVANNPVNTVDPVGEYGRDVHGYFTYFAVLAAGGDASNARTIGSYTWGPDVGLKTGAVGVLRTDFLNTFAVQTKQHALTGEPPELLRDRLYATLPEAVSAADFGRWSHVFQDSYAHIRVNHAILTWLFQKAGSSRQFQRAGTLYRKGLGHALSGTLPDKVSTSPAVFREMAAAYYSLIANRIQSADQMPEALFSRYVLALTLAKDTDREDLIKYIVRPCADEDPRMTALLHGLPRLALDLKAKDFVLPKQESKKDWDAVEAWVLDQHFEK